MERLIAVLHIILLICCPLVVLALAAKLALIIKTRGLDMQAFMVSFFRIYSTLDKRQTSGRKWRRFLILNNRINYFLYFFIVLFLLMFMFYGKNVFSF